MKKIIIKINKLGRIRNSQVEISPLMIFSGESGMGKSYIAMLVHYFFEVLLDKQRITSYFQSKGIDYNTLSSGFISQGVAFEISKKDFENWLSLDSLKYIQYMINNPQLDADIEVVLPDDVPSNIVCYYSEEASSLENDVDVTLLYKLPNLTYRRTRTANVGIDEESPFAYFFRYYLITCIFGDYRSLSNTFVFPPSRGSIMTEKLIALSGMYKKFSADKIYLESAQSSQNTLDEKMQNLIYRIMEGQVTLSDNQYIYKMDNDSEIPLSAAASSIRELAPLEMLIENIDISKVAFLLEEPEAHLHPIKQRMMADLIFSLFANGARMQITTHSDYFIKRFNEIFQLIKLKGYGLAEELNPSISNELNIEGIQAYLLKRQEDGSSVVVKQDLLNGVPYTSFYKPLKEGIEMKKKIEDLKNERNDSSNKK